MERRYIFQKNKKFCLMKEGGVDWHSYASLNDREMWSGYGKK